MVCFCLNYEIVIHKIVYTMIDWDANYIAGEVLPGVNKEIKNEQTYVAET